MIAQPHDGLALRQCTRARWCDRSIARWSHTCPGAPPLSAQPAGDTGCRRCSAAGQLGVAVVRTRAHEYDDWMVDRTTASPAVCTSSLLGAIALDRTLVSRLSGHAST
eukprot:1601211-Prymnesium_polylepis.1